MGGYCLQHMRRDFVLTKLLTKTDGVFPFVPDHPASLGATSTGRALYGLVDDDSSLRIGGQY
jgi:hypothetical protein